MAADPSAPISSSPTPPARAWVVALVTAIGLAASFGASAQVRSDAVRARDAEFDVSAERARSTVATAVRQATTSVLSVRNVFAVQSQVSRSEFRDYLALQRRDGFVTGAQGVAFARRVLPTDEAAFTARVRADDSVRPGGYPDFGIHPEDGLGPERFVVEYVEPFAGNEPVFGFDLGSSSARRDAIEQARDLGDVTATVPIVLVQDTGAAAAASFLMIAPVYDTARIPTTAPARRRHFVGVVSAGYRVHELLSGRMALGPDVRLEIYDVGSTVAAPRRLLSEADLLFDSDGMPDGDRYGALPAGLFASLDIDVGGRRWRLVVVPGSAFDSRLGPESWWVLGVGLLATLFAAVAISTLTGARRRAEVLAADLSREARAAEERFRIMVERSPDPTFVVGTDGDVRFASDAALRLLGVRSEQLIGSDVDEVLPGFARADGASGDSRSVEIDGRTIDGTPVPLELTVSSLPTGETIVSARDVSAQQATRRALEEADEAKTAFLGTISHELRTPLAAIKGFTEMLLEHEGDLNAEQSREMLERVDRNAAHLGQLIEEVLTFSRLERRDVQLTPEPTDLGQLVRRIVEQLTSTMAGHRTEVDVDPVQATVDPDAVTRVVTNLLTNAARYSPHGSTVHVSVRDAVGSAVITVDDEGPGVPVEERARIFERFYRGSTSGAARGTGVGLTVVKELVEMHGGTIEVARAPTGGARFEVRIPATRYRPA